MIVDIAAEIIIIYKSLPKKSSEETSQLHWQPVYSAFPNTLIRILADIVFITRPHSKY